MPMLDNPKHELTAEYLRSILRYDEGTGLFRWAVSLSPRVHVGDIAGSPGGHRYIQIQIMGRLYLAHILAWVYMTGEWPDRQVDHRDTDRANNTWKNLRLATPSQNCANQGPRSTNKSGVKGLYYDRTIQRWRGSVTARGNRQTISAVNREDAMRRLLILQAEVHGDFARAIV